MTLAPLFPAPLRRVLASMLALLAAAPLAAQGENGYLRGAGNWLVGYSFQEATFEEAQPFGGLPPLQVDRRMMSVYLNVGLTESLDVIAQPLYQRADLPTRPMVEDSENLTDLELYFKWRVWRHEIGPGEASFLLVPGVKTDLQSYQVTGNLGIGAGQTDWRARGIAHYQAKSGGWWVAVESGYDFRTSNPPDNLVVRAHVGLNLGLFVLQPYYDLFDARGGRDVAGGMVGGGSPAAAGIDFDVWGLKTYIPVGDHVGLFGSVFNFDDDRETGVVSGTSFGIVVLG